MKRKVTSKSNSTRSKQLTYYHKNKERINQKRRQKYKLLKLSRKQQTNLKKASKSVNNRIKPSNDNEAIFNKKYPETNDKNTELGAENGKKLLLLSLDDQLNLFEAIRATKNDNLHHTLVKTSYGKGKTKSRYNPILGVIVKTVLERIWVHVGKLQDTIGKTSLEIVNDEFDRYLKKIEGKKLAKPKLISPRSFKRYIQKLVDLKWLLRIGKGQLTKVWINPFLLFLYESVSKKSVKFCNYASYGLDFFDVLNRPLLNMLQIDKQIKEVNLRYYDFRKEYTVRMFIKEWFEGVLTITFILEDGSEHLTALPVNLHGPQVYNGLDKNGKQLYRLYKHICIPLKWSIFDITEVKQFGKDGKKERIYLHFDNSFSLLVDKDKYGNFTAYYLNWVKYWENAKKKLDGYEYLEFNDFSLVEYLFEARFVKQKRRDELIQELGLKLLPKGGRGKKKRK